MYFEYIFLHVIFVLVEDQRLHEEVLSNRGKMFFAIGLGVYYLLSL